MTYKKLMVTLAMTLLLLPSCVINQIAGNSSQTGNPVVGKLYQPGGKGPARGDSVVMRSRDYRADIQRLSKRTGNDSFFVRQMRTDDSGYYRFDSIPRGAYCIEARDSGNNRALIEVDSSLFVRDTIELPPDTLKAATTIPGKLLTGYVPTGTFIRVLGLDAGVKVGSDSTFLLENLPEGNIRLLISIAWTNDTSFDTIMKVNIAAGVDTLLSLSIIDSKTGGEKITFQKILFDSSEGNSVEQTSDGGYIIAGWYWFSDLIQPVGYSQFVYLMKTDARGTAIWKRTFGSGMSEGNSVQQTSDGGYIIVGDTSVVYYNSYLKNVYLLKTDAAGGTTWIKYFKNNDSSNDAGSCVRQTREGGYIIVGQTEALGGQSDVYLIKTGATGTAEWTKTFSGGDDGNGGNSVQQTRDGGYIIAGWTQSILGQAGGYLIKTDPAGTAEWTKIFGGCSANSVQQTRDGGYIIAGSSACVGTDTTPGCACLVKTDPTSAVEWTKTYAGTYAGCYAGFSSVQQTSDGGYICAGSIGSGPPDIYLIKTDQAGTAVWTKTFGGTGRDEGYSVQQTSDGGYIITGKMVHNDGVGTFLIKTDANGDVK